MREELEIAIGKLENSMNNTVAKEEHRALLTKGKAG